MTQILAFILGWFFAQRAEQDPQQSLPLNRAMSDAEKNFIDVQLDFYETYRKYIIHQDNITNNRMTWLLTIHGFLYAIYGFGLQKRFALMDGIGSDNVTLENLNIKFCSFFQFIGCKTPNETALLQVNKFLVIIFMVGIVISSIASILVIISTGVAWNVGRIGNICLRNFATARESSINTGDTGEIFRIHGDYCLPAILGGGKIGLAWCGRILQICIPLTLVFGWVGFMFMTLY